MAQPGIKWLTLWVGTKHAKGQVPPKGLKRTPDNQQPWLADEFSYNSSVKWIIRVVTSPLVSHGPALTYEECVISLYQAINYCWGNNQDTR